MVSSDHKFFGVLKLCYHKACKSNYLHAFYNKKTKTSCMKMLKVLANLEVHVETGFHLKTKFLFVDKKAVPNTENGVKK